MHHLTHNIANPQTPKQPDRRKPTKQAPLPSKSPQPEEAQEEPLSKRARKPPSWLQSCFEDLPAQVRQGDEQQELPHHHQQQPQQPVSGAKPTKPVNWRLLDMHNLVVELDLEGQRYRGVLERAGPSPTVGVVQEVRLTST